MSFFNFISWSALLTSFNRTLLLLAAAATLLTLIALSPIAQAQGSSAKPTAQQPSPKLTKAPELLKFVEAEFPESEKARTEGASVVLQLVIAADGTVSAASVLLSAGAAFDEAALAAARAFEFAPAEIDGKPASIKIQYRYDFVLKEEVAPLETSLQGEVRRRDTGGPLANVSVQLDSGQIATTDAEGRFSLPGIVPGKHTVTLSGPDLAPLSTEETVEEGTTLTVRYDVELVPEPLPGEVAIEKDDLEILVQAPKLTKQVTATRVDAESARRVAGTQGDVLKIVENLPGVARAAAGSGDVIVWGAAPQDTRVYVDGVRVPLLYHFGGLRSVVHSELVQAVELVPGAYGAAYGRGLGGLVIVDTREPSDQQLNGALQLDLLDASVAAHGKLSEDWRIAGALRRSHLREVLSGSVLEDVQDFFPIPEYQDANLRLRYEPKKTEWVEVSGMLSHDAVTRSSGSQDPLNRRSETKELGFDRISLRYRSEPGDGTRATVVPWFGREQSRLNGNFGPTPVQLRSDSTLYGLRASWTGPATEILTATAGFDIELVQAELRREGSISAPPREGDARVFGQPPADQINVDQWKTLTGSAAPYVEGDLALLDDQLHVIPGLRLEPFFASVNRRRPAEGSSADVGAFDAQLSVQPRLAVRYALDPTVTFKAGYGRYRQPAPAEDLSSVFGNPLLGTANATHYLLGGDFKWTERISTELTLFYARSEDLAVRNPVPSPRVAETLVADGKGRSFGLQLLLRRELAEGLMGWVAYTLLRSERKDAGATRWRLFDFDQTHVLTALASYELGYGIEAGVRARLSSGYPRTPVVGAYYDARRDQYEPLLGDTNSDRVPAFFQIDARVAKRWKLGGSELEAYLDVLNVANRKNAEEIVYSADYSERRFINGLPILPVVGAQWNF